MGREMFVPPDPVLDDQRLARYLLGQLSEEEAERIDDLVSADEEVASRLRAVEDDLVDAYARGTLAEDTREQFQACYLIVPARREKVRFARSLLRRVDASGLVSSGLASSKSASSGLVSSRPTSSWPQPAWHWALAAAAAVLLIASGVLVLQRARVREAPTPAEAATTQDSQAASQEGERPSSDSRGDHPQPAQKLDAVRVALVLVPTTRTERPVATLAEPSGADPVGIQLEQEFNDFPRYQAALIDAVTNQIVWRSDPLEATLARGRSSVSILVPVDLLRPQHYAIALTGLDADGTGKVVGSYAFEVVPK
jgi:hypothetical protein